MSTRPSTFRQQYVVDGDRIRSPLVRHGLAYQKGMQEFTTSLGATKCEEGGHVADASFTCFKVIIRAKLDEQLRLCDPIEDFKKVVGSLDVKHERVRCGKVLGINDLELIDTKLD